MYNEIYLTKANILDQQDSSQNTIHSSGDHLYFNDEILLTTPNINNYNEFMMIQFNLTSGSINQKVYYPPDYTVTQPPKVFYSIFHADPNNTQIIPNALSEISTSYFGLKFAQPIPDEFYYVQAVIFKYDNWTTFSGAYYDVDPIRVNNVLRVDPYYGWDNGTFTGLRENPNFPFRTLSGAYGAALDNDVIVVGPGEYTGISVEKNNLSFMFLPEAKIVDQPMILGASGSSENVVNFYNLQIGNDPVTYDKISQPYNQFSGDYGVFVSGNAVANFHGTSKIFINSNESGVASVSGDGSISFLGDFSSNKPLRTNVLDNVEQQIIVEQNLSSDFLVKNNKSYYKKIQPSINDSAENSKIFINNGNYETFVVNKNINIEFSQEAKITGSSSDYVDLSTYSTTLNNIKSDIPLHMDNNCFLELRGDNFLTTINNTNNYSIYGSGTVLFKGNTFYDKPLDNSVEINYIDHLKNTKNIFDVVYETGSMDVISGHNTTLRAKSIEDAISFAKPKSNIFIKSESDGFTSSKDLNYFCGAKISGSIDCFANASFYDLNLDTLNQTGIDYGVFVDANVTGNFKNNSSIRIPSVYQLWFTTGININETGKYVVADDGNFDLEYYPKTDFQALSGGFNVANSSGVYGRKAGQARGLFVEEISGLGINGGYSTVHGFVEGFNDGDSIPTYLDTIGKIYSGTDWSYFNQTPTGIAGNVITQMKSNYIIEYYSGMKYAFASNESVTNTTAEKVIGVASNGEYFENNFAGSVGVIGTYYSGDKGEFTTEFSGLSNYTGYYYTGVEFIPNTEFTTSIDIPFVSGYYYLNGLSGYYIVGDSSTGVYTSGIDFDTKRSISGNGVVNLFDLIYNQEIDSSTTNNMNNDGYKPELKFFEPSGYYYV